MTQYPLLLVGERIAALVVGGGRVAARKTGALVEVGARVTVVAPAADPEIARLAAQERIRWERRRFTERDVRPGVLVYACTDDPAVNARAAARAAAVGALANVADDPARGTFAVPAVHRAGDLVIAVGTGGVPAAGARIRDDLARRYGATFADAVTALRALRRDADRALTASEREAMWRDLCDETFVERVRSGDWISKLAAWRSRLPP